MSDEPNDFWKRHPLYFVGASVFHRVINSLPTRKGEHLKSVSKAIPGLSCKPTEHGSLQSLLSGELKGKSNLVLWSDIINNTVSDHPYKYSPALPVSDLLEILKKHSDRFSAIVYCRKEGTIDIFEELLILDILILKETILW